MSKLVHSLADAIRASGLQSGMTVSFHHHLRNGDAVLNMVLAEAARQGLRDLTVQASSLFDVHLPLLDHIRSGVVTGIETNYMAAGIGRAISEGILQKPVVFRSHGGRPAAIESGRVVIDVAFIAAPASDAQGNANGVLGSAACGSLGYAIPDAKYAKKVVIITDHLMPYPLTPQPIEETDVDLVVQVDSIGDPKGIVSGTTRITRDPVGLSIAKLAAQVIAHSGLMVDGFSFQTGAGGASLAVTEYLKPLLRKQQVQGSFGLGGITGYLVDMLNEGYFGNLMDVQCFDLAAVASIRDNPRHQEISATRYASPNARSCAVKSLDTVVLGATEIDLNFNVNVHTDSNGYIMGGSGGHSDTAEGAKLSLIVAPLFRARLPIIVDKVTCVTTKGSAVDVLVTQRGVAINPRRQDLKDNLKAAGLPVFEIDELQAQAHKLTGVPVPVKPQGRVVAQVEYPLGGIVDEIRSVCAE